MRWVQTFPRRRAPRPPRSARAPATGSLGAGCHRRRRSRRGTRGATPRERMRLERRGEREWPTGRGPWSGSFPRGRGRLGRLLDGSADSGVGATAANVARHRAIDVRIGGMRRVGEKRRGGHDLTRLAVAALYHLEIEPGLLHALPGGRLTDRLDGGDALTDGGDHGRGTRADRLAVQVHGAGAAQSEPAPELRAREAEHV